MAKEYDDISVLTVVRVKPTLFLGLTFGYDNFDDCDDCDNDCYIKVLPFEEDIAADGYGVITISCDPEKLEVVDLSVEENWVRERYEEIMNILRQIAMQEE